MFTLLLLCLLSTHGLDWKQRISQRSKDLNSAAFTDRRNLNSLNGGTFWGPGSGALPEAGNQNGHQHDTGGLMDWNPWNPAVCSGNDEQCQCQWFGQTVGCFDCDCEAFGRLIGMHGRRNLQEKKSAAFTDRRTLEENPSTFADPSWGSRHSERFVTFGTEDDAQCQGNDEQCQCQWFGQTVGCFDCDCESFARLIGPEGRRKMQEVNSATFTTRRNLDNLWTLPSGISQPSPSGESSFVPWDGLFPFGGVAGESAMCRGNEERCECQWHDQTVGCFDCDCEAFARLIEYQGRRNLQEENSAASTDRRILLNGMNDDGSHSVGGDRSMGIPHPIHQFGGSEWASAMCQGDRHDIALGVGQCQCQWYGQTVGCFDCDCDAFARLIGNDGRRNLQKTNDLKDDSKLLKSSNVLHKL